MRVKGKCSWFGGPSDSGMKEDEPLAFIYEVSDQPDLFLEGATEALGRSLDPEEFYVACRWPYTSETKAQWRDALLSRKALVRSVRTGKYAWAFPADWGPADEETGGRVADLSPALLEHLQLETDDEVQVWFPTKQVTIPSRPELAPPYPSIVISAGHGLLIRGAAGPKPWGLDEVDEARKVVGALADRLRDLGVSVTEYFDDVSTTQDENLERICDFHNSVEGRDLDISIHFNAYEEQETEKMGCEVFAISQMELAADISAAMASAADLPDRGAKTGDLYFLNHTEAPSLLIETLFCDSRPDCDSYRQNFDAIVESIAGVLSGNHVA